MNGKDIKMLGRGLINIAFNIILNEYDSMAFAMLNEALKNHNTGSNFAFFSDPSIMDLFFVNIWCAECDVLCHFGAEAVTAYLP